MQRILLTGANGQLGAELRRSLQGLGEIIALSRRALDLDNPDMIRSVVRAQRPSLIVNAAAYTPVDQAESNSALAYSVNATAPGVLAEEAKRINIPLIHYSTDYVFDGAKLTPYDEHDIARPRNVYGESKLDGERAVQASGCRHLIFRTGWLYSERGHNFVKTMLRLGAQTKHLRVVQDQYGAPTWARTIAESTAAIIANNLSVLSVSESAVENENTSLTCALSNEIALAADAWWHKNSGIYHMCADGQTTWAEFAASIFASRALDCTVVPIASSEYPTPALRPRNSCLSNEKLADVFGVRLPQWQDALALFLNENSMTDNGVS